VFNTSPFHYERLILAVVIQFIKDAAIPLLTADSGTGIIEEPRTAAQRSDLQTSLNFCIQMWVISAPLLLI
jgi:hypothetical protein